MLGLVLGVSVILYIFDVPILPSTAQIVPTIMIPTLFPTQIVPTLSLSTQSPPPLPITPTVVIFSKNILATVDYFPEGRSESITVSLTLSNFIISGMAVNNSMNDGKSRQYQLAFESEIQPLVVGKDIKTLNLSRVAGASFTTDAFMQAIEKIKSQI